MENNNLYYCNSCHALIDENLSNFERFGYSDEIITCGICGGILCEICEENIKKVV